MFLSFTAIMLKISCCVTWLDNESYNIRLTYHKNNTNYVRETLQALNALKSRTSAFLGATVKAGYFGHSSMNIKILILYYFSVASIPLLSDEIHRAQINFDGRVTTYNPQVLTVRCAMKVASFPFDTQSCEVKLSPWMYGLSEVVFRQTGNYSASSFIGKYVSY